LTIFPVFFDLPDFLWDVTKEGHIIFSEGNSNVLQVYNLEGKMSGQVKTPLAEAPEFSSDDLNDCREKTKIQKRINTALLPGKVIFWQLSAQRQKLFRFQRSDRRHSIKIFPLFTH